MDQSYASMHATFLKGLGEAPLYSSSPNREIECYRFTWLRSFHRPVIFRLDVQKSGEATLMIKLAERHYEGTPPALLNQELKQIDQQALVRIRWLVAAEKFFELPSYGSSGGNDGARWLIEVVSGGRYHAVSRWSPRKDSVNEIGRLFIEMAMGGDLTPIY
jgi:hypothetical protein